MIPLFLRKLAEALPYRYSQWIQQAYYIRQFRSLTLDHETDLSALSKLIRRSEHAVDIGANLGLYAKFLSEAVGAEGRLIACEPIPRNFDILKNNLRRTHLDQALPILTAVSDFSGEVSFQIPRRESGDLAYARSHVVTESEVDAVESIRAPATTLDALVEDHNLSPVFIKCDVEGHELRVIRGASETIRRYHPAWMIEVDGNPWKPDTSAAQLLAIMHREGYSPYRWDGSRFHELAKGETCLNTFFLQDDQLQ